MDRSERRGGDRVSLLREVQLRLGGRTLPATMLDLSASGAAVWGPKDAPEGPLQLVLPLEDGSNLALSGAVVRAFNSDGGSVWGIEFDELDDTTKKRIEAYIEHHLGATDVAAG